VNRRLDYTQIAPVGGKPSFRQIAIGHDRGADTGGWTDWREPILMICTLLGQASA
jgi:hypothetical protein